MEAIIDKIVEALPVAREIFMWAGLVLSVAAAVDRIIPDEKDGGFMTKVFGIPVIGGFLKALKDAAPLKKKK